MKSAIGYIVFFSILAAVWSGNPGLQNIATMATVVLLFLLAFILAATLACVASPSEKSTAALQGMLKGWGSPGKVKRTFGLFKAGVLLASFAYFGMFATAIFYLLGIAFASFCKFATKTEIAKREASVQS